MSLSTFGTAHRLGRGAAIPDAEYVQEQVYSALGSKDDFKQNFHELLRALGKEYDAVVMSIERENDMLRSRLAKACAFKDVAPVSDMPPYECAYTEPVHDEFVEPPKCTLERPLDSAQSEDARPKEGGPSAAPSRSSSKNTATEGADLSETRPKRKGSKSSGNGADSAATINVRRARSISVSTTSLRRSSWKNGDGTGGITAIDRSIEGHDESKKKLQTSSTHDHFAGMVDIREANKGRPDGAQRVSRCMLSPVGKPRMFWDMLWCISLAYDMWWSMFLLVFLSDVGEDLKVCKTLSYVTLSFWIIDILLNFFTGHVVNGRHIVLDRRAAARRYAHTWLCFDVLATFPFDEVITAQSGSETFSMIRGGKATKVVKLIKALKLMRATKLLQMGKRSHFLKVHRNLAKAGNVIVPILLFAAFLCFFCHFHGCLWASARDDWSVASDSALAFQRYRTSFWWAYSAITFGTQVQSEALAMALVEAFLCAERFFFIGILGMVVVLKTLKFYQERTQLLLAQDDVLSYLKDHDVGAETQLDVLFSLVETAPALKKQKIFHAVVAELPLELRRAINKELWSPMLLSLELLAVVTEWHDDAVVEISQLVKEEVYATKAVVCREGDPAIAAYYVIQGKVAAMSLMVKTSIPDYVSGNWMGERALMRTGLNRSVTATCIQYTLLMMVPSRDFHKLLEKLHIDDAFRYFVEDDLEFLCGRCGQMGSHNSDNCPSLPDMAQGVRALKFSVKH